MRSSKHQSQRFLFLLNIAHVVIGLLSVALALGQFTSIGLDNAAFIDFRLLNVIHVVTGCVGAHMIAKNFGSVVSKTLYILSLVLSLWTLAFYTDTLIQESSQFESIREIRKIDGGEELINDEVVRNHGGKIALCSVMILLSLAEASFSAASLLFLDRLASGTYSNWRGMTNLVMVTSMREVNRKRQMAFVALMKIVFSVATLALGAYLEALYKRRNSFMKIGWQELVGAIAFAGACVDLKALYGRAHNLLNLKVSLVLSVATAVLSLKTLDYTMANYFVLDVREYSRYDELKNELKENLANGVHINTEGDKKDAFVKFVIHASIIGCLALIFAHSVISAVEAGSYIEWKSAKGKGSGINISVLDGSRILGGGPGSSTGILYPPNYAPARTDDESDVDVIEYDESLHKQKACTGTLQCVWGLALIALCVMSLVSWDFSGGYDGGAGVLWLGCLFIASGLINANRPHTFTTSIYTLNVVSLVLAFERAVFSLNVVYQAAQNPRFKGELDPVDPNRPNQRSNYDIHIGRIALYSIEAGVLVLEFLTALWTAVKVSQAMKRFPRPSFIDSNSPLKGSLCSLGLFHLLYAFVAVSISIAGEVALWGYNVHVSYLVYMTNGIVVLANVFVQWTASQRPQFLLCSAIFNIVTASTSFFVIAPAVRDLYTIVANYRSLYEGGITPAPVKNGHHELLDAEKEGKSIQEWIIGLNALVLLLAIVEYVISIVSGMICSYLLHHAYGPSTSDLRFSTLRSQPPTSHYWSPSGASVQPPSVLAAKLDNGHDVHLSRHRSHHSLNGDGVVIPCAGSKHPTSERRPERYFGGTNDFGRLTVVQPTNDRIRDHYPSTSAPTGLRRIDIPNSNGGGVQHVSYDDANGHYGNRGNGVVQSRHAYPSNGAYMTTYT